MKTPLGITILALILTCVGCVTTAPPDAVPRGAAPTAAAKTYPPVTVNQLKDKNGHQVARSLEEEMDRETQQH